MKETITQIEKSFIKMEHNFVFVSCCDEGGFNHLAITQEQAEQISIDYGYVLKVLPEGHKFEGKEHGCKFMFRRALV